MQRVTVTLDDQLMADLDVLMAERGYQNRSEAIRDMTRAGLARARTNVTPEAPCVAAVIYTYDHHSHANSRLTASHHDHTDLAVSTLHVHVDTDTCLEVSVLKGQVGEVRHFAEHLVAQRTVRNGEIVILPTLPTEFDA